MPKLTLTPQVPMIETVSQLLFNQELRRHLGVPKDDVLTVVPIPVEEVEN